MEWVSLSRAFCGTLLICCAIYPVELQAYPGKVDIRVLASNDALKGQARDLEQTLLATVYSLGGKIGSRGQSDRASTVEKARKTLSEIHQLIHPRLSPTEIRDLRVAADSVEQHFREKSGSNGLGQWADLVRAQASLLALSGHQDQARDRFLFLFNLQPESGPESVQESLVPARAAAVEAHLKWKASIRGSLLFKDVPENGRMFVDGRPVTGKDGRVSGLREGLHLVQVITRDTPPFETVVRVQGKGLASVSVRTQEVSGQAAIDASEIQVFQALNQDEKVPANLVSELPKQLGVEGVLFVSLRSGAQKTTLVRGVWVHSTHGARYLSMVLKPGTSFRQDLERKLKEVMIPVETP